MSGHPPARPGPVVVVAHVDGGSARVRRRARQTAARLRTAGHEATIVGTGTTAAAGPVPSAGRVPWGEELHAHLERREADGSPPAAVVAVGGDGLVHTVVNVLMERAGRGRPLPPFGLVPAGSGNDLARHMTLPRRDVDQAVDRIVRRLREGPDLMDLGHLELADGTTRWFATAVCCGIDAAVTVRAASWRRLRGPAKYLLAAARELPTHQPAVYAVAIREPDGRTVLRTRRALMLTVANTSSIGGGLPFVPHADPRDGALDLLEVRAVPPLRVLPLLPRLLRRTHLDLAEVTTGPVQEMEIDATTPVSADGELLGTGPLIVRAVPRVLPVLF